MFPLLKKAPRSKRLVLKAILTLSFSQIFTFCFGQVNPTPAGERMQAVDQRRKLEARSLVKEVEFKNIGPSIMSGRVTDIDANPEDPTEFYVAYATGGLWHTTNNGQS